MGEAEIHISQGIIELRSHIITYGNAASELLTERIRAEIEDMWNAPRGMISIRRDRYLVRFRISSEYRPMLSQMEVVSNLDPRNNYFRIEEKTIGNISFVDGLGCNTGYFQADNLYEGSTTAAHEFGHTLGLDHPEILDIRGTGQPGIMYPRGTLVDPEYQYDSTVEAGKPGGTLHPKNRQVLPSDIEALNIQKLSFRNNLAIIGNFTNQYHPDHAQWLSRIS